MKTQILSVAMIAGFVLVAGDASAQRGADFGTLDTDGNGSLTLEEVQGAAQARFDAADADRNGSLSLEELTAMSTRQREGRIERMMTRLDENEDGALTIDEMRGSRSEDRAERMFERIDQDEDGVISEEEFAEVADRRGRGGRGHGRGNK